MAAPGKAVTFHGRFFDLDEAVIAPGPVSVPGARAAGTRCRLRVHPGEHPFPGCFVCGPDRAPGDGLHILVGPVAGRDLSADLWYPAGPSPAQTAMSGPSSCGRRSTARAASAR